MSISDAIVVMKDGVVQQIGAPQEVYDDPVNLFVARFLGIDAMFGKGVFAKYLKKGPDFAPDYEKLLRSCGSAPVREVAASVGIDVGSADFWRSSLEVIRKDIDEFCALAEKHIE